MHGRLIAELGQIGERAILAATVLDAALHAFDALRHSSRLSPTSLLCEGTERSGPC